MKATDLLRQQHHEVEQLFERFEKAEGREKKAIFEEIAKNLVAHDAIEREIFYPACEKELDDQEILLEALVEHGLVEFTLFQADRETRSEEKLDARVKVLKDIVLHHVEEEHKEMFPKAEKALGQQKLEQLGQTMEQRFEEALEEDFRAPLQANVRQVIGGAVKTSPARGASARRATRATTARPGTRTAATARKATTKRSGAKKTSRARKGGRSRASR